MSTDENLKNLQQIARFFKTENLATPEQMQEVLEGVIKLLTAFKKDNAVLNEKTKKLVEPLIEKITKQQNDLRGLVTEEVDTKAQGIVNSVDSKLAQALAEATALLEEARTVMPKNGKDGRDGKDGIGRNGKDGKNGSPDTPEKIIEKINSKGGVEALKGLDRVENNFLNQAKALVPRALAGLYDVNLYGLTHGQVLSWDSPSQKWRPTAAGDNSVTLADVSANSLTAPNSLYTMTSGVAVEFRSSDGNTLLYLDETNERIGIGINSSLLAGLHVAANGAASLSGQKLSGTWFTGGSGTTTKPLFLIEPTGTTSTGWSTSGTGLGVNAASGFTGNLADFQVAGTTKLSVDYLGRLTGTAGSLLGISGGPGLYYYTGTTFSFITSNSGTVIDNGANAVPILTVKDNGVAVFTIADGGDVAMGAHNLTLTGSIASTGSRVTKGWFTDLESTNMPTVGGTVILTSLTAPQFTTIELGHATENTLSAASGVLSIEGVAIPTISSTSTLTNKRITQRVVTTADDATAVIDVDVTDQYQLTAMANATTISTTGTPTAGQKLTIRLKDNGTGRALTWDGVFRAIGVTLPTTTVANKTHYIGCIYNLTDTKWDAVAVVAEA